jgi:hypothetical protein
VTAVGETSGIGCAVCALAIDRDDEAIELLRTITFEVTSEVASTLLDARPAYVHVTCGIPDGDTEVRRGPMGDLRP